MFEDFYKKEGPTYVSYLEMIDKSLKLINKQLKLRNLIEISKLTPQEFQNYNTLVKELRD